MPKYYFIVNPHSSNGKTGKNWPALKEMIESKLGQIDFALTKGNIHATYLAGKALFDGFDRIVAVGGDGTLNETLNGFYDSDRLINSEAMLGHLPSGTGDDIARTFELDGLPAEEHIMRLAEGCCARIDIASAQFIKKDGTISTRKFINETSAGFGADVASAVNTSPKLLGDKGSYLLGILRCLVFLKNRRIKVTVDGNDLFEGPSLITSVANGKYFGGGMMLAPHALADDGLLDVIIIEGMGRLELLSNVPSIYSGRHIAHRKVICSKGKEIHISSSDEVHVEMDGEPVGKLDVQFKVHAKEIPFII